MDKSPKNSDRTYYLLALRIIGDFGATIAAPAIIFVIIGQWLDEKYGKYPLFTALCLFLSFLLTAKIIIKKAKKYGDDYNKLK